MKYGHFGVISSDKSIDFDYKKYFLDDCDDEISLSQTEDSHCFFCHMSNNKFSDEKIFVETNDLIIQTDGIFLNSKELYMEYNANSIGTLIQKMFLKDGELFVDKLRGFFNIIIYKKNSRILRIFSDHISSHPVFYYYNAEKKTFYYCSDLICLSDILYKKGNDLKLSETGAYCLLTFGFMLRDNTLVDGIKKVSPGTILRYEKNIVSQRRYFILNNTESIKESQENIISHLDKLFKNAVYLEYLKDLDYNYKHIATLSGGLDSRMTVMVAKIIGFKKQLCFTYCQSNYLDETISKKIASEQGFEFLFYSLDNGNFLTDIESPLHLNSGQVFYAGAAPHLAMMSLICWKYYGLLHTGMVGDGVLGSLLDNHAHTQFSRRSGKKYAYSSRLIDKLPINEWDKLSKLYGNTELFALYERGFNGALNGLWITKKYTEFSSPFLDRDFLEYALKISPEHKYQEKIYRKWIISKYPEIAKYPWEKTGLKISTGQLQISCIRILKYLKRRILSKSSSMNPFDDWYSNNKNLRDSFKAYYQENIEILDGYPDIQNDIQLMFNEGNTTEKTQVLSLLGAMKLLKVK